MKYAIYSSSGETVRYSGAPTYHGTYMKPAYLEFTTIASPTEIQWEIGDFVIYERVGEGHYLYELYNIPQPEKRAVLGMAGEAFVYSNVQFFARTKQLEIAPFRDLVIDQGLTTSYHFSTLNSVDTFENVAGIAARIQKCLDNFVSGWDVRVETGLTGYNESEARAFSVSGGSVLDALEKIYEVWPGLGWTHYYDEGDDVNVLLIGGANKITAENTTTPYYFKAGITRVKANQSNLEDMCTRLYAYGSTRNMIARHYNTSDVYEYDKVYIPNLMIPKSSWGLTETKPDASKAFLEHNTETFGVIPKFVYFDGSEQQEIYPSIREYDIVDLRGAKIAIGVDRDTPPGPPEYMPDQYEYEGNERIDEVGAVGPFMDNGKLTDSGDRYAETVEDTIEQIESLSINYEDLEYDEAGYWRISENEDFYDYTGLTATGKLTAKIKNGTSLFVYTTGADAVRVGFIVRTSNMAWVGNYKTDAVYDTMESAWRCRFDIKTSAKDRLVAGAVDIDIIIYAHYPTGTPLEATVLVSMDEAPVFLGIEQVLSTTFNIKINNIGFDMMERAALSGNAMPTIAFYDGKCVARSFSVKSATYDGTDDTWDLVCYRGDDTSIGMRFPNSIYPVSVGDHFVLLDIAMPDEYIYMAEQKLLTAATALLNEMSEIEYSYEPSLDSKKILQNIAFHLGDDKYILREGKLFQFSTGENTGGTQQLLTVIIDTLTIKENESSIPTYSVTLRDKKRQTFKQSFENTLKQMSSLGQGNTLTPATGDN